MNTTIEKIDLKRFRGDLQAAMQRDGLNHLDVYRKTGVNPSTISLFVNGKREGVSGESILRLWEWMYGYIPPPVVSHTNATP